MKRSLLCGVLASVIFGSGLAAAAVNCDQVVKNLKTGRTAQDIADTMVIPLEEVKKCEEAAETKGASGAPAAGSAKAGDQPATAEGAKTK